MKPKITPTTIPHGRFIRKPNRPAKAQEAICRAGPHGCPGKTNECSHCARKGRAVRGD